MVVCRQVVREWDTVVLLRTLYGQFKANLVLGILSWSWCHRKSLGTASMKPSPLSCAWDGVGRATKSEQVRAIISGTQDRLVLQYKESTNTTVTITKSISDQIQKKNNHNHKCYYCIFTFLVGWGVPLSPPFLFVLDVVRSEESMSLYFPRTR